jgi:hypothetical protein
MTDQIENKRGRGRPPKYGEPMPAADRQRLYARARQRDMAEVAFALQGALRFEDARTAFVTAYRGTVSGERLQRGLTRISDDSTAIAFFAKLISSYDEK